MENQQKLVASMDRYEYSGESRCVMCTYDQQTKLTAFACVKNKRLKKFANKSEVIDAGDESENFFRGLKSNRDI